MTAPKPLARHELLGGQTIRERVEQIRAQQREPVLCAYCNRLCPWPTDFPNPIHAQCKHCLPQATELKKGTDE